MTSPINYAAERAASRARTQRLIREAKREFDAYYAAPARTRARAFDVGRPSTLTRDRALARSAKAGTALEVLVERTGLTMAAIRKAIYRAKQAGTDAPTDGRRRRFGEWRNPERDMEIVRRVREGEKRAVVGADFGLTRKAVDKIVRRHGSAAA